MFKARFSRLRFRVSASGSAKAAFIVGLLSPLVAPLGLAIAFWAAYYDLDRPPPHPIMTPILLLGLAVPVVFCLAGVVLGIIGMKSEERNSAIAGVLISGLTFVFCFGFPFFH